MSSGLVITLSWQQDSALNGFDEADVSSEVGISAVDTLSTPDDDNLDSARDSTVFGFDLPGWYTMRVTLPPHARSRWHISTASVLTSHFAVCQSCQCPSNLARAFAALG